MNQNEKISLLKFLFSSEDKRQFLCNDMFQELMEFLPVEFCINDENRFDIVRKENIKKAHSMIADFVNNQDGYKSQLFKIFNNQDIDSIISDLISAYVFYVSQTSSEYRDVDVFADDRCISYLGFSLHNIIN